MVMARRHLQAITRRHHRRRRIILRRHLEGITIPRLLHRPVIIRRPPMSVIRVEQGE